MIIMYNPREKKNRMNFPRNKQTWQKRVVNPRLEFVAYLDFSYTSP